MQSKRKVNRSCYLLLVVIILLQGCFKKVRGVTVNDYTSKSILPAINNESGGVIITLDKILVVNTTVETIIIVSHEYLEIHLNLLAINKSDSIVRLEIYKDFNSEDDSLESNFEWLISKGMYKDKVVFESYDEIPEYTIKPKDSVRFSVQTHFYSFEKLLGWDKKDYTKDMLYLLSNFELTYKKDGVKSYVNQNDSTKVIFYNGKTKWSWW